MKCVSPFIAMTLAAIGSVALVGCQSNSTSGVPRDDQSRYAGGNGAFGESPAQPGAYTSPGTAGADSLSPYAGGNGAFGESPAEPGAYTSPPTTKPSGDGNSPYSGGNGAFGESPAKPGAYGK